MRITFLLVWLLSGAGLAGPSEDAAEYRQLRQEKGWFSGGGAWNDRVDKWGGRKHELMTTLAEAVGDDRARLRDCLGEPDEIARPGSVLWGALRPAQGDQALIYFWRGHHDFLYFLCDGERILRHDWWRAGE